MEGKGKKYFLKPNNCEDNYIQNFMENKILLIYEYFNLTLSSRDDRF